MELEDPSLAEWGKKRKPSGKLNETVPGAGWKHNTTGVFSSQIPERFGAPGLGQLI